MAELKLIADSGGGTVALKAPATTTSNAAITLKLPVADGSANQLLKTDGSGNLGWATDSATDSTKMPLAGGTFTGDTLYNDSVKAKFGTDNDLELYHTGSHGYILNKTGNLVIRAKTGETGVEVIPDGAVQLRYDNSTQLETTSTGIKLGGSSAQKILLTGANNPYIQWQEGTTNKAYAYWDHSNNWFELKNEETGSKIHIGTSTDLYHGSNRKLETQVNGVNITSASNDAELKIISTNQDGATLIRFASDNGDDNNDYWRIRADGSGNALGIQNYADGAWESNFVGRESGGAELYYDNSKKFETTSIGATLTGRLLINNDTHGQYPVEVKNSNGNFIAGIYESSSGDGRHGMFYLNSNGGTNHVKLSTNGASYLTGGNVGIGISTPDQTLHVRKGDAGGVDSASSAVITIESNDHATLQFLTPNDKGQQIRFGDVQDNGAGWVEYIHSSNALAIGTNGPEKLRIDSSGRVLIGTTTEGHGDTDNLTISDSRAGITLRSNSDNYGAIYFSDATSGAGEYAGYLQYNHIHNRFVIGTNSADEIVVQSGGGISFNGEIAAANALNDYEVGTWNAYLAGSSSNPSYTASHQAGTYTKIGNRVIWNLQIIITAVSSQGSGNVSIGGLPFSSAAGYSGVFTINYNDIWNKNVKTGWASSTSLYPSPNQTNQHPCTWSSSAGEGNLQVSTGYFTAAGQYQV